MFHYLIGEDEFLPAKEIDESGLEALSNQVRRKILRESSSGKFRVQDLVQKMDLDQQTAYYHLKKLESSGLLNSEGSRPKTYETENTAYYFRPDYVEEEENPLVLGDVPEILEGFIQERRIKSRIIVGAPYPHGETNRRHRNAYKAGEIASVLGNYGSISQQLVHTDKELSRKEHLREHPLISLGGFRVNTFTDEIRSKMPIKWEESGDKIILESGESFTGGEKGFITRAEINGEPRMVVAGISGIGASAAIHALHQIPEQLGKGAVVEGFGTKEHIERVDVLKTL